MWLLVLAAMGTLLSPTRGAIANVTRNINTGDSFFAVEWGCSDAYCSTFGAFTLSKARCNCQCPQQKPAFFQDLMLCNNVTDGCKALRFVDRKSSGALAYESIPTTYIPLYTDQTINANGEPDWAGAGIAVTDGKVPCQVIDVVHLTEKGWRVITNDQNLFFITQINQGNHFQWKGTQAEGKTLEGKIVQLGIQCDNPAVRLCATLRISGTDYLVPPSVHVNLWKDDGSSRIGIIVGVICGALLILTLLAIILFWLVCWKQQKTKLIQKIHRMYQQERMGMNQHAGYIIPQSYDVNGCLAQEVYVPVGLESYNPYQQAYNHGTNPFQENWMPTHDTQSLTYYDETMHAALPGSSISRSALARQLQTMQTPNSPQLSQVRKKLYFSPEFLEPECMATPPPSAQEFLQEVRRMIDMAKFRIRSRRYIPSLSKIPEAIPEEDRASSRRSSLKQLKPDVIAEQDESEELDSTPSPLIERDGASPHGSSEGDSGQDSSETAHSSSTNSHENGGGTSGDSGIVPDIVSCTTKSRPQQQSMQDIRAISAANHSIDHPAVTNARMKVRTWLQKMTNHDETGVDNEHDTIKATPPQLHNNHNLQAVEAFPMLTNGSLLTRYEITNHGDMFVNYPVPMQQFGPLVQQRPRFADDYGTHVFLPQNMSYAMLPPGSNVPAHQTLTCVRSLPRLHKSPMRPSILLMSSQDQF